MSSTPYWKWFARTLTDYRPVVQPPGGANIIIGYAQHYRLADLRAFVTSIERHVAAPFILIATLPDAERAEIEAAGGQIVPPDAASGWRPLPMFARVMESLSVLRALPKEIENVVWCDTRDLIFQRDPFRKPSEANIVLYGEASSPALGDTATGRWLASALGEDLVRPLASRTMANAGVIRADRAGLERFLHIVGILAGVARSRLGRIQTLGLEQGLFNYVSHHELAGPTLVAPNLGRVANLAGVDPETLPIQDGLLCAPDTGEPFEIVHMFDRHARTVAWARENYGWQEPARRPKPIVRRRLQGLAASIRKRLPEIR
jgi:hypothetical protein